jgi:hypothetical protein
LGFSKWKRPGNTRFGGFGSWPKWLHLHHLLAWSLASEAILVFARFVGILIKPVEKPQQKPYQRWRSK